MRIIIVGLGFWLIDGRSPQAFIVSLGHVYPLWPCPEGKEAREDIAEIIASTTNNTK